MSASETPDLTALFATTAARFVDRPCLGEYRAGLYDRISYGEVARQVRAIAAGLAVLGVGPGSIVSLPSDSRPAFAIMFLAIVARGATCQVLAPDAVATGLVIDLEGPASADTSYRGLLTLARRASHASDPNPIAEPSAFVDELIALARAIPIGLDDRVASTLPAHAPAGLTLGLAYPLVTGALLWRSDDIASVLRDASKVQPTVLVTTPEALAELHSILIEESSKRGPIAETLLSFKLELARKRRHLAAERRRDLALNLGHKLLDRVAARHIRGLLGHHLSLIVAVQVGSPLAPEVREPFELLGIAVTTPSIATA